MSSKKGIRTVTPAEAGVQDCVFYLDSGPFDKLRVPSLSRDFRRNDGKEAFGSFHLWYFSPFRMVKAL